MERFSKPDTYAVWSKDEDVRYNSTSGGAFSEFAKIILAEGGLVAGARYNDKNLVEHSLVDSIEGLEKLRQSKYISSSPSNIYREVKIELIKGKTVAFCGAPCQVAGLYAYLGKEYDNLITMDFICRGMNSPKAFQAWLDEIEKQVGRKVTRVWFKYKDGGWKSSPTRTRLDFADGHYVVKEGKENLFMHGYLSSNLYIRPCCGECRFKGVPRKSDMTFADFWGIEKKLDDDKGTSMLLVNSKKGRKLFEIAKKHMEVHEKGFESIFTGNPMFSSSVIVPENSHNFLKDLDNMPFSECIKKYTKVRLWQKVSRKILNMKKK